MIDLVLQIVLGFFLYEILIMVVLYLSFIPNEMMSILRLYHISTEFFSLTYLGMHGLFFHEILIFLLLAFPLCNNCSVVFCNYGLHLKINDYFYIWNYLTDY